MSLQCYFFGLEMRMPRFLPAIAFFLLLHDACWCIEIVRDERTGREVEGRQNVTGCNSRGSASFSIETTKPLLHHGSSVTALSSKRPHFLNSTGARPSVSNRGHASADHSSKMLQRTSHAVLGASTLQHYTISESVGSRYAMTNMSSTAIAVVAPKTKNNSGTYLATNATLGVSSLTSTGAFVTSVKPLSNVTRTSRPSKTIHPTLASAMPRNVSITSHTIPSHMIMANPTAKMDIGAVTTLHPNWTISITKNFSLNPSSTMQSGIIAGADLIQEKPSAAAFHVLHQYNLTQILTSTSVTSSRTNGTFSTSTTHTAASGSNGGVQVPPIAVLPIGVDIAGLDSLLDFGGASGGHDGAGDPGSNDRDQVATADSSATGSLSLSSIPSISPSTWSPSISKSSTVGNTTFATMTTSLANASTIFPSGTTRTSLSSTTPMTNTTIRSTHVTASSYMPRNTLLSSNSTRFFPDTWPDFDPIGAMVAAKQFSLLDRVSLRNMSELDLLELTNEILGALPDKESGSMTFFNISRYLNQTNGSVTADMLIYNASLFGDELASMALLSSSSVVSTSSSISSYLSSSSSISSSTSSGPTYRVTSPPPGGFHECGMPADDASECPPECPSILYDFDTHSDMGILHINYCGQPAGLRSSSSSPSASHFLAPVASQATSTPPGGYHACGSTADDPSECPPECPLKISTFDTHNEFGVLQLFYCGQPAGQSSSQFILSFTGTTSSTRKASPTGTKLP